MDQARQMPAVKAAVLALLCLGLAGCGSVNELFKGESDGPPLAGKRETVIVQTDPLEKDEGLAGGAVQIPAAHANASWAQPGGTPSNAPGHLSAGSGLQRIWRVSAGSGSSSNGRLTASPVIYQGRIYTIDTRARVSAFNASSGGKLWSVSLVPKGESSTGGFGGGLAADDGRLFVTTGFGEAHALDPQSGRKIWTKKLSSPVRAAPTALGGKVFFVTTDNWLFALNASDGEVAWDFRRYAESAGVLGSPSPAVSGGIVVAPYSSGEVIAFKAEDGKPAWADSFSRTRRLSPVAQLSAISGRPVIDKNMVFAVSHSGRMGAVNMKSGERVWARNIGGTETPWVAGNTVFVVSLRGIVYALTRDKGKVRWYTDLNKQPAGAKKRKKKQDPPSWSGPVLAGGRLLLVSSNGQLAALSPSDGRVIDRRAIGGRYLIPPVVAGGMVYLLSNGAQLSALR